MNDHLRLAKSLETTAERLRMYVAKGDWVDAYRGGELITTDVAAFVVDVSTETIRRRAAEAAQSGHPIGIQPGTIWLISLARLLDWIELHEGRPARLFAETRARQIAEMRPQPRNSMPCVVTATPKK